MKKCKAIFTSALLIILLIGCFKQKDDKNNTLYKVVKSENKMFLFAEKELDGIEIVFNSKVEEGDLKVSSNLLKILRKSEENTILSVAGEIKPGSKIVELTNGIDIKSVETIVASKEERTTKRAGEVLLGDFDSSGTVDLKDFVVFAKFYGTLKTEYDIAPATKGTGVWSGINCYSTPDGMVNLNDFIIFAQNYGKKMAAAGYRPTLGTGNVYHVAKSGNDSTGTGTINNPWLTINRAVSVVAAGDTIKVHADGRNLTTYTESTVSNPYVPPCEYVNGQMASIAAMSSGTPGNPITLMAFDGDEGLVQISGSDVRIGIHPNKKDYWQIWGLRIVNCYHQGIGQMGQVPNHIPNLEELSTGWHIENCLIKNIIPQVSENSAGISPWATKDWVIRNVFSNCPEANMNGLESYGTINLLVENCKLVGGGNAFFLKDHFISTGTPRTTYNESEVRYSELIAGQVAYNIGIRGTDSCESGDQYVHNNAMYGADGTYENFIYINMGEAYGQSKRLRIENNVIDVGTANVLGLQLSAFEQVEMKGNVWMGFSSNAEFGIRGDGSALIIHNQLSKLTYCDYNVYSAFRVIANLYSPGVTVYSDLEKWREVTAGVVSSIGVSNPDIHSIEHSSTGLFINYAAHDYRPAVGSSLIGMMPDGSNAGCYQTGKENIGLLPSYSAGI